MAMDEIRGHLDSLLLAVLADGAAHGYAVIAALRERSEGRFDLPEGTVYPALHRLEREGLLAGRWVEGPGRRRREYAITTHGRAALAAERERWLSFSGGVRAVTGWAT
jgi:PadR family transcriptional regulator PadR